MNRCVSQDSRWGSFCVRHFFALLVVAAVACILWTVAYFGLLLWTSITYEGGGLGSPLTYPIGLLLVLGAAILAGALLLFPAAALAEWVANRYGWPKLAQLPLSVGFLACISLVVAIIAVALWPASVIGLAFIRWAGGLFVAHIVPLGIYWLATQSVVLFMSMVRILWRSKNSS